MRFKDFGETKISRYSKDLVSVSSTIPSESETIKRLELKNKSYLDPWRITTNMDSSSAKIFTVKFEDRIVGQVILFNFQTNDGLRSCSISYWIDEDFSGKGIATQAVQLTVDHAFNELGVHEVDATIQPENAPSIRVIEKLSYVHRDMLGEGKVVNGKWQNFTLYTVTQEVKDANI